MSDSEKLLAEIHAEIDPIIKAKQEAESNGTETRLKIERPLRRYRKPRKVLNGNETPLG